MSACRHVRPGLGGCPSRTRPGAGPCSPMSAPPLNLARVHEGGHLSDVEPTTFGNCSFCGALHTRPRSVTCSDTCARSWRRKKAPRADHSERMTRGIMTAAAYATQLQDLASALVALEDVRAELPSDEERELLDLWRALPDTHRDVLIGGLRRAVAKLSEDSPVASAAE